MKKLLFFMAILSLLTACSPETRPETNSEPIQEVSGDYQFTVSGDDCRLEIPAVIGGKKVTAVADTENMDADQRELAWIVTIADGVTEICDNAFNGYKNLKTVTIPASVTVFGNHLFADCPNLERIYFEGNAPRIEKIEQLLPFQWCHKSRYCPIPSVHQNRITERFRRYFQWFAGLEQVGPLDLQPQNYRPEPRCQRLHGWAGPPALEPVIQASC